LPRAQERAAGIVTNERGGWAFATRKRAKFALEAAEGRLFGFWGERLMRPILFYSFLL